MKRAVFLSLLIILCLVAACGCAGGSVERGALLLETDHAAASNGGGRAEESRSMRTEVGEAMIGEKRAREIALKHAGVEEAAATRMKVETDREKGRQIYEVEFLQEQRNEYGSMLSPWGGYLFRAEGRAEGCCEGRR